MKQERAEGRRLATNRRARHDYHLLERFEAGLVLLGTEVKSAREGRIQLKDGYVEIRDGEAFLIGIHIGPYRHASASNHDPERPRKLLLKRREIERVMGRTTIHGLTCIPLAVYIRGSRIKVEIALARGKKLYDKRQAARQRLLDQEAREALGRRGR